MDTPDLVRLLAVIEQVKANVVRIATIEGRTVISVDEFKKAVEIMLGIFERHIPQEQKAAALADLCAKTRYDQSPYAAGGP
jgi:hypothetical protein